MKGRSRELIYTICTPNTFHLVTQVDTISLCLCLLLNVKKNKAYDQLDNLEANNSRFVKIHWVIEQVFARLKNSKSLLAYNATLAHDFESFLIALLNLFHKLIFSDRVYKNIANVMISESFKSDDERI